MTQERFFRIVDDPNLLRTISYEELKTLALAYPYAHNLRYFLAIKARQIDHQDVDKNVATAAVYSLDRTQLFRLVAPQVTVPQEVWVKEEVLELKPVETIKRALEEGLQAANRVQKEAPHPVETAPIHAVEAVLSQPTPTYVPANAPEQVIAATANALRQVSYQTFKDWFGKFNPPILGFVEAFTAETSPVFTAKELANKLPISEQMNNNHNVEMKQKEEDSPLEPLKIAGVAQMLAEKSVLENKDVISETLAKLYVKQGYRDRAIAMYERLCLAFPEKSTYFAAEIDKLKK
jgi:hypothetical protein